MADVQPFRALRYDTEVAGALDRLVAPPYDVVSREERRAYAERSPYNVVHLTLPEGAAAAARRLASWRRQGVLAHDAQPSYWALAQDYVGPDGVPRTRSGLVGALHVEPYERRVVLPHERTHRGPKEERLRILRATRTQLEPILLLYDAGAVAPTPEREPDVSVEGARLWRVEDDLADAFSGLQLLIADGHHRYETAVAFAREDRRAGSARMLVVLVSTDDPGLTIFPTHRLVRNLPAAPAVAGDPLGVALDRLEAAPRDRAAAVVYRGGAAWLVSSAEVALDTELVSGEIVRYTPDLEDAVRAVEAGEAEAAYIVRPPRVEDVFAAARLGEVMPQKTTYFFPKLLSGLLLLPLDG